MAHMLRQQDRFDQGKSCIHGCPAKSPRKLEATLRLVWAQRSGFVQRVLWQRDKLVLLNQSHVCWGKALRLATGRTDLVSEKLRAVPEQRLQFWSIRCCPLKLQPVFWRDAVPHFGGAIVQEVDGVEVQVLCMPATNRQEVLS